MIDLPATLADLAASRPLFHSEADFQHALAWLLRERGDAEDIRLEKPERGGDRPMYVDILARRGAAWVGIELKYWTRTFVHVEQGEEFSLRSQCASDLSRYAFWSDVARLEQLCRDGRIVEGWAVALTNDSLFWRPSRAATNDDQFRITDGRTVSGELA